MHGLGELYISFFKIGALTFGGGYAMLPMLEREIVQKHHWATSEDLLDYFAIGQCTPGVIAVNTATFIGAKLRGVIGGIVATLGVVTPSLLIITVIAALLQNFMEIAWIQHMFAGIRVAVTALILSTVIKLVKSTVKDARAIVLCVAGFAAVAVFGVSPIWVVLIVVALGLSVTVLHSRRTVAAGRKADSGEGSDLNEENPAFDGEGSDFDGENPDLGSEDSDLDESAPTLEGATPPEDADPPEDGQTSPSQPEAGNASGDQEDDR